VPTGPLFQSGSGANGSFQRMADGAMICRHVLTASAAGAVTWTFPSPFFEAPVIGLTAIATVSASAQMDAAPSATAVTFSVWNTSNARRADVVHLTARGRWSDMT